MKRIILWALVVGAVGVAVPKTAEAKSFLCKAVYAWLGSDASDSASNDEYFGAISWYNKNCGG